MVRIIGSVLPGPDRRGKYAHQFAVDQTTEWLEHHGIPYWDLCFMRDKAAVGADLYIEDAPRNVEQLRTDGHETIVFSNSTNRQIAPPRADTWADVEEIVIRKMEEWVARVESRSKELSGE